MTADLHTETCSEYGFVLQAMKPVNVPTYDFTLHQRSTQTRRAEPADVIVVEGILVLHMQPIRSMLNMKVSDASRQHRACTTAAAAGAGGIVQAR